MSITELMQKFVICINSYNDSDNLKRFITINEPTFDFGMCEMNAYCGCYWCHPNGRLIYSATRWDDVPDRPLITVGQLINTWNSIQVNEANKRFEKAINQYEKSKQGTTLSNMLYNAVKQMVDSEEHPLSQIHISFDGMTTHCIAKNKKGVVARSMAKAVGEDADNYDQLIGTMVAIAKLVPAENRLDLFNDVLSVMGVGIQMPIEAKLVYVDEK